jgi:Ca-activated chloride channel homolog
MNSLFDIKRLIVKLVLFELLFHLILLSLLALLGYFSTYSGSQQLLFNYPSFFQVTWFLPILYLPFILLLKQKTKRYEALASSSVLQYIVKLPSLKQQFLKAIFLKLTFFFILLALAQPVFGTKKIAQNQKALEVVLTLDVSNSMNAKDLDAEMSRLEIIKRAMIQLVNSLNGEKIGICVFAGGAYVQLPITMDYGAAKMFINEIETEMVSNQGTNIELALNTTAGMFSKDKTNKAIILVTDGESHEGDIKSISEYLNQEKIVLAILGVGTKKGGKVPNHPKRSELGYKLDPKGKPVITKLNTRLLMDLAKTSKGLLSFCENSYPDLTSLIERLKQTKQTSNLEVEIKVKENWYQMAVFLALISLLGFVFVKGRD